MRIVIATDAWRPQVNGVVHTLEQMTAAATREFGTEFEFVTPEGFATLPLPTYPDIRVALATSSDVGRRIRESGADHVHIATEGPIGWAARSHCLSDGATVHDQLSHPLPRIYLRPHRAARGLELCGAADFSCALAAA